MKKPRRRTRANGRLTDTLESLLIACSAVLIVTIIGSLTSGKLHTGLHVGDIIVFKPEASVADGLGIMATRAAPTSQQPSSAGVTCTLDPAVMAHDGGSIVIERTLIPTSGYEVHWAGLHTSNGKDDCGPNANVTLSGTDLQTLVDAIGGLSSNSRDYLQ